MKKRLCYDCKKQIHFESFCAANPEISRGFAIDVWKNDLIELLCCNCLAIAIKKFGNENVKKIILTGLSSSGKNDLLSLIDAVQLDKQYRYKQSNSLKGIKVKKVFIGKVNFIWTFSDYRFENREKIALNKVAELIFMVEDRQYIYFPRVIEYFQKIYRCIEEENQKPFNVSICVNKTDYSIHTENLIEGISEELISNSSLFLIDFKKFPYIFLENGVIQEGFLQNLKERIFKGFTK